mgnify:FL=1
MILARWPSLQIFCDRNKLGSTNTLRTSLNRGRFTKDLALRLANGLGISYEQLLDMGAVIVPSRSD